MGNSQPEGASRDGGGGSSNAPRTANTGTRYPTRARTAGSPAPSALRNDANKRAMDAPRLPARGGPDTSSYRRCSPRLNNMPPWSSDKQQHQVVEATHVGMSKVINNNASNSSTSRGPGRSSSTAEEGAKEHISGIGSVSSSSKKRKRMTAKSYRALFKLSTKANSTDAVVVTSGRVGKENTSSGNVAESNTGMLCESGRLIEKDKKHSNDTACKDSRSPVSGLHETSETRIDRSTTQLSELHQYKSTDACPQNKVAESEHAVEGRVRSTGDARQDSMSSLQCAPISHIHHEESKSGLGDGEPLSFQKEVIASRPFKLTPSNEVEGNSNRCIACGTPGDLKSCDGKGCKRSYHISCLDHWLVYLSPGIWFCTVCTEKRLLVGIHSVADVIESVWNVKEGTQNGKQYFVKYKNLGHVHNRWVPEGVINDTPGGRDLLSLFNKRDHKEKKNWKKEWTEPHRLLRKRPLMPRKEAEDFFCSTGANIEHCNVEWLVKWRDLGYEQATWELETSCFMCTPQVDELKRKYENRCKAAKQSSIPMETKVPKTLQKLQRLPDEWPPGFDNDHLFSTNQLLEFWHKSHCAVLVDDKEYVIKTILFMLAILPDVCQPFLIVTTPASLSAWEVQFNHLAPFINVVVYDGQKDTLKLIQDLEFYENRSCMMLQVLLSHPDAILEDIETIQGIHWEAVIVDYCENSSLKYLEQLKKPSADFRMVLLGSPIKDNLTEYMNLLAFLNPEERDYNDYVDADDALVTSKARFTHHIAYERKENSSKFMEYWVPSHISRAQLEIYCSILLSKSSVLQSEMKTDSVGALHDIYLSLKKCCDHPYLVDEFSPLSNNSVVTENMDFVVHASGKLLLLNKMLKEIKKKKLRVILLFQSDRAGGNRMGNILEGFVRHRFGPESYERVEYNAVLSRKQAAINKFNDKTNGRFIFLIENRACLPSIKLSSIDAIIIYGIDNIPLNDLKALQKVKIESQSEHVSIFRLYTPFTVEERSLVLVKQGILIDNNIQGLRTSLQHSLLSWGASFLFARLDEVQQDNHASKSFEMETLVINEVIVEFLTKLSTNVEDSANVHRWTISKANMSGELYSRNITLMGEKKGISVLEEDPAKFWLNLLDGRSPCMSYVSELLQSRVRKFQTMVEVKAPAEETDEARKKRRKAGEVMGSSSKVLSDNSNDASPKICTTSTPSFQLVDDKQQKLGSKSLMSTPKNLHAQLNQGLSKLIKLLQLPDNVSLLVEQLLEYLLKNHLVAQEPKSMLHALNIALCWRAASFLNYKVDHRESLALAEKSLKYECNEELASFVFKGLRELKKKFPQKTGATGSNCQSTSVEKTRSSQPEISNIFRNDHIFPRQSMDLHDNFRNGALQEGSCGAAQMVSEEQELIVVPGTHVECHLSTDELPDIVEKEIDLIDKVFCLRENHILDKQQSQVLELDRHTENKITRLKRVCNIVLEHIRRSHIDVETRNDTMKRTVHWFTMLIYAFLEHMRLQYSKLKALQSNTWAKERQLKEKLCQEAKSGQLDHSFDQQIALSDSNFVMEEFIHLKEQTSNSLVSGSPVSDCQQLCHDRLNMVITLVRNVVPSEPISSWAVTDQPTSEVVGFPDNNICSSPDGIGLQKASCSPSTMPSNDDSIHQESFASEYTSTENVERDNANPITLLGGATSPFTGVDANNYVAGAADPANLESTVLASTQSLMTLSSSKEVATKSNLSTLPVSQAVETSQHPPTEAELAWDVQPEMQTMTSTLDSPFQRMCPDDNNQMVHQPDTATGPLQEGATSCHLALVDTSAGVTAKVDDSAPADPLDSEAQSYTAAHNPGALLVAREDGVQTDHPRTLEQQSTGLPPKQSSVPSQHPTAEAELTTILNMETAQDLQLEMRQSASALEASLQRMHPDDGSQTKHQPETAPDQSQRGGTSHHFGVAQGGVDANNGNTVFAVQAHLESPTVATPQSLPVLREVETAEVERTDLLVTQPDSNFQPEMQPSTALLDASLESNNRSQTDHQPDHIVVSQEGATTQQHLVDGRVAVKAKNGDSVAIDTSHSESPISIVHETASLAVSAEVETQTCQLGMSAEQNTSQPAQQSPPTLRHLTGSPVGMETTQRFQPKMQTSISGNQSAEAEQEDVSSSLVIQDLEPAVQPSISGHVQPADAEQEKMPSSAAIHDLEPEMQQLSTSGQDQSAEVEQEGMPSSAAVQDLDPGIQPPNSVQNQYAEREEMLSTAAAEDLQPAMQPPTSVQDQLAEANQEGMLSAAAAWHFQPEMQQSTSMHDAPFERADQSGISMPQSITVNQSVVSSSDLHTGVEPTGALCMGTTHESLSESQPSCSMQERSAETGVGVSCAMAACDLQPQMEPQSTMQHVPLERIHREDRNQIVFPINTAPQQSTQPLPVAPVVFNYQRVNDEPLKNELERLNFCRNHLKQNHEQKRKEILVEYNQELEKVKNKYDLLLQKEDSSYTQKEAELEDVFRKVSKHQSLAENFRRKFILSSAAQGGSMRPTMWQPVQSSQQLSPRILPEQVTASPVSLSSAPRSQVLHSSGPYAQPPLVVRPSTSRATQLEPILPGNIYRAISSPFSTIPVLHAPPPHLQQLRMPSPYAMSRINQQQLPVNPGVTSLRQLVPGIMESSASTSPHEGSLLTSLAPNAVNQTMQTILSASNSDPAILASSLPLPDFMANFVPPCSSNPSIPAFQSSNMVVHSTSSPLNAAAGSQHTAAQISGVNHSGSPSASLNAWLTDGLRLTGNTEVVCLSDDES
uniref:PHD-type domain-containing protein n=1 Tax=Leersia perrieri TaxID=77586 RepID=A0A0D9VB84_9ORYZ